MGCILLLFYSLLCFQCHVQLILWLFHQEKRAFPCPVIIFSTVEAVALPCTISLCPALCAQRGNACIVSPASGISCHRVLGPIAPAYAHRTTSCTVALPMSSSLYERESSPFVPSISSRLRWLCPLIVAQNYHRFIEVLEYWLVPRR